ncbi:hypothetical protein EV421DRAFT_1031230 [Armillaria borealis]|uniref:Uncharacterized protein n=1 Tax=Armillaria borealis TaxID=47425 RepID=A0AA39IDD3_9AGAR|nr:hypothetical protein EV421DRAFT_1031230 [Armillaria borealis]
MLTIASLCVSQTPLAFCTRMRVRKSLPSTKGRARSCFLVKVGASRGSEARWCPEGYDLVRHGYERERVGKCAVVVAHVRGIEYFCDECDVGNGGDVHGPYMRELPAVWEVDETWCGVS